MGKWITVRRYKVIWYLAISAYLAVMFTIVLILDDGRLREEVADDTPFKPKLLLDEPEPDDEEAEEMVHGEC